MLKGIIFDLDGTITVLTLPLAEMRRNTKNYFIAKGLPEYMLEPADGISSTRKKAREYFLSHDISESKWVEMEAEINSILSHHEGEAAKEVELISGALEAVNEIKSLGLKTAILTNNGRHAMDIILERIPLSDVFEIIQTRNESAAPKPYPNGLLQLARRLTMEPSEIIYIGDATIDGTAADRAGVEFWGVTTGSATEERLHSVGATMVFESVSEVVDEVKRRLHKN